MTPPENLRRMRKLAEEFFAIHQDPSQLAVDDEVISRLLKIHPGTVLEEKNRDGPVAWMLIIPTTEPLMRRFIREEINERQLLEETPLKASYEAIYLCSALVLPEFRRKGLSENLACRGIGSVLRDHPIKYLFVWSFSHEGATLAEKLSLRFRLPLLKRSGGAA